MNMFDFIKEQITELTDTEEVLIKPETLLEDIDLVSLDFISIQVALKKHFNIALNIDELHKKQLTTLNDFIFYLSSLPKI